MAKEGIEYFPLNCRLDEKFELIEAEFGLKGFAVIVKLLQRIYGEHGYYCEWNEDIALLFARQVLSCSGANNLIASIVAASVRRGIFDQTLFDKYGILTSRGIQKRYLEITYKRKKVEMKKAYLLLSDAEIKGNVTILGKNDDRNDKTEALQYAITDPFWKTNIRSTAKLREKFETLILQVRQRPGRQAGGTKDADESKAWGSHRDYYSMYRA